MEKQNRTISEVYVACKELPYLWVKATTTTVKNQINGNFGRINSVWKIIWRKICSLFSKMIMYMYCYVYILWYYVLLCYMYISKDQRNK